MEQRQTPSAQPPAWLRWQRWLGLLPLTAYLVLHLGTQAAALGGPRLYAVVTGTERPAWRLWLEVTLVYVPLALHALLGALRLGRRRGGVDGAAVGAGARSRWLGADLVQPLSAAVLLVFLVIHAAQFPVRVRTGQLAPGDVYPQLCALLSSTAWGGVPVAALGYLVGTAAAAVHAAHGVYRVGLDGRAIGDARRGRWAACCGLIGAGLFVLGALIVIDLATGSVLIHFRGP